MLLEEAQAVIETEGVCDGCLGRCFADRGRGLSNDDRGHALRVCVALIQDAPFEPVEPEGCWVCEGLVPDHEEWAARVERTLEGLEFETFLVGTHVPSVLEENEAALRERAELDTDAGESFKAEINREVGKRLEQTLSASVVHDYPDVVAILNLERDEVDLQLNPEFLYGRYRKLERGLAQRTRMCRVCNGRGTQWRGGKARPCENCGGSGYITERSVEQLITRPIRERLEGTDTVFNTAGREDDDVGVLGSGRPFVVEVKEPRRRPPDLERLQAEIDEAGGDAIEVEGLSLATKGMVEHLTQTPIRQTYRLTVAFHTSVSENDFTAAIAALDGATVRQQIEREGRTVDRIRTLGEVTGELRDETEATIEVDSMGGIGLEALMRGGDGRIDPNLAALLDTEVEVTGMDVLAVEGEEEPLERPVYLLS